MIEEETARLEGLVLEATKIINELLHEIEALRNAPCQYCGMIEAKK